MAIGPVALKVPGPLADDPVHQPASIVASPISATPRSRAVATTIGRRRLSVIPA
jgi:hypothetical protein